MLSSALPALPCPCPALPCSALPCPALRKATPALPLPAGSGLTCARNPRLTCARWPFSTKWHAQAGPLSTTHMPRRPHNKHARSTLHTCLPKCKHTRSSAPLSAADMLNAPAQARPQACQMIRAPAQMHRPSTEVHRSAPHGRNAHKRARSALHMPAK